MVKIMLIFSFTFSIPCLASMQGAKQAGKEWGQKEASSAFDHGKKFDAQELLSDHLKNQTFDAKEAASKVENRVASQSETLDFLTSQEVQNNQRRKSFHEDELFINKSEQIFANTAQEPDWKKEDGYTLHTCKQAGDPFLISTERTLNVLVNRTLEELAQICFGHEQQIKVKAEESPEKVANKLKEKYKKDPLIKAESVEVTIVYAHPTSPYYFFQVYYEHVDNLEGFGECKKQCITDESFQEVGEEWVYDNQELWDFSKSPDSTIIEHVCVDASPTKVINGKSVARQCWKEKISFLYQFPSTNDCNFLKQKQCEQIKQECIQYSSSTCVQWQLTFRCLDTITRKYLSDHLELDTSEEVFEYTPNQSFSEVAAKLAVFDEVKKEMEKSNAFDVRDLEIFKGRRMSCSKNVADHLMYDCCFSYSGLAKQMGLSKCNADEISLAEMREQGLCHYVGSYEEKILDLWKSRDEHVFCCFPSKLSRIVQEQGRKQLGMDWGHPKEPNCRGFSTSELSSLNFSKMDLSEICEDFVKKMPDDMSDRLQAFQNRLQQDIEQSELKK